jgi:hypothetical protein
MRGQVARFLDRLQQDPGFAAADGRVVKPTARAFYGATQSLEG